MPPARLRKYRRTRLTAFLLLRYTLIAATAYLLIVEQGFAPPPPVTILLVVAALASNVILGRLSGRVTRSSRFALAVVVGDTVWITAALVTSGKFSGEFFYLYFLVLLMAAIGENLQLVALGALAVCGAYLYLLMASGNWSLWSSPSLIRIPFLFAAAAFYGHLVDRARHERRRADRSTEELRAEAEVAAALVRVGRAMISSLDTPIILDRLCEVTTEVLACDRSRTFLLDHEAGVFVPLAAFGDQPEWWAGARLVRIPHAPLATLLASLETEDVAQVGGQAAAPLALGGDDQAIIAMALRRGTEVIGIHTASLAQGRPPFSPRQQQIASKLAQIASMSLANAKLVEELESANRIKSDFVASMSHELRTPLNLIIGYNELLIDGAFGPVPGEQREVLQRVASSSRELLDMIQATLDLSRLESNRVALEASAVEPSGILADLEAETRALRTGCTLRFEWAADADLPTVHTDAVKLKMVLKNLIGNALKFTERGSIAVRASARADGVEFVVSDTGIGIAPADQGLIFEPFHQVARDRGRHRSGAGLGLYIARRLTEMLGGTIALESAVDRGSTFRVWIAAMPPALAALELGASPPPTADWRRAAADVAA